MPTYDAPPLQLDHELVIGDTYRPGVVRLVYQDLDTDPTGNTLLPHNLTGCTGEVVLVDEAHGTVLLEPTFALVDATDGKFSWSSAAGLTAVLDPARAKYRVRVTWPSGDVRTVVRGVVTLTPDLVP